eukprot:3705466-Rhodomonas_salina.2
MTRPSLGSTPRAAMRRGESERARERERQETRDRQTDRQRQAGGRPEARVVSSAMMRFVCSK